MHIKIKLVVFGMEFIKVSFFLKNKSVCLI